VLICRVGQNHIYGVYTVFLAGKSQIYGSGRPYLFVVQVVQNFGFSLLGVWIGFIATGGE
jgi:hypothetical protein